MAWIDHLTNLPYEGDRANPSDLETAIAPPSPQHTAIIENGQHTGWSSPPPPVLPHGRDFRRLLLADLLFAEWQLSLPTIARENLKIAAIADDWETCQAIYNQLKGAIALPPGAAEQWQALASAHAIPLTF